MAFVLADRVRETTTTTGTGTVTLNGAVLGFQTFAAIGNANNTYYAIAGQGTAEWEVGIGTYTASGTTLSRDTVLASSNAGSLVVFSAGTKDVFCDYPAGKAIAYSTTGSVDLVGELNLPASTTTTAGLNIGNGVAPTSPTAGDIWGTTTALLFRGSSTSYNVAFTNISNSFSSGQTFASTLTANSTLNLNGGSANNANFGTSILGGSITVGGTSQVGTITLGQSTATQTTNIQAGATTSGNTKTINFGTGGLSGSTTTMNIGSAVSGSTTTVAANGTWTFSGATSASVVRASNGILVNSQTVSANYTIATGDNGFSAGPVTVNSGISVTVSSGSVWTVV